mmetsp:Transcript_15939/g.36638  ORF Transcript_15939/g.36638 Transcript_15939/m.36638 type:complete len:286 (-) Transcript_15939:566-1423(-)
MEFEKSNMASTDDVSTRQSSFLGTAISKFTTEGVNTLRRYLDSMPDSQGVMKLYMKAYRYLDAGSAVAKQAMEKQDDTKEGKKLLTEASRLFALGKADTVFHKVITDDQIGLLEDQEGLRSRYSIDDVAPPGSSLAETIIALLKHASTNKRESHKLNADADRLAKKFRVPEKRLWHLKVKAYAESGQWPQLRSLGDSKAKPPIGFKPFARVAIQYDQGVTEITRYIDRVQVGEERYGLFCEAKLWKRAVEEAVKLKDPQRIMNVRSICNSADIQRMCDEMMGRVA